MASLDYTFGAILIGVILAAVLYGFTCIQTWYYYTHYPSDPWYYKLFVLAVFLSDTTHQILISHAIYTYVITYYGVYDELAKIVWTVVSEVILNALSTLLVQCFMTMRVWKLSNKNLLMTSSSLVMVLAEFILSLFFAIQALQFNTFAELETLKALSLSVNAVAAAGDAVIAAYLCYLLQKVRTGFQRSDTIINKLVAFSLNTGLLTSVCALASLISYSVWPRTFIYVTFYFCIGRLYCNSLLATLNLRKGLKAEVDNSDMTLSLQGQDRSHSRFAASSSKRMPSSISIKINTTRELIQEEQCSSPTGDMKNFVDVS